MRIALALLVAATAVPVGAVTVTGIPSLYYTPDTSLALGAAASASTSSRGATRASAWTTA